jgi:hypothetical protein
MIESEYELVKWLTMIKSSVADPECLSRIPDPNFFPTLIPDPGSKRFPDLESGSASASKNLSILTQNVVSKLSEI